ncbi:MAG: glycosyltransferase family 4 protein [Dehalococcoidia bacterium]
MRRLPVDPLSEQTMRCDPHDRLAIALIAPYDLAIPGGVNAQIRAQARALRRRGHVVRIVGPSSRPEQTVSGEIALGGAVSLNVGGTVSGLSLNPLLRRRVRAVLAGGHFDVVHIHEPLTPVLPWLFLLTAPQQPRVGTFHVHRETGHRLYAAGAWFLRSLIRRLDARIAVSDAACRTVARHFPGAYEVIPNGIDVGRFHRPPLHAHEPDRHKRTVLFVGRIEQRKGLPILIRATAMLRARLPDVRLVVVGDGPDREANQRLAGALGCDVTFAGRVPDERLPAYLRAAQVFCSPATGGESFGVVLLEAMAAGTPVVASDIDGYAELLATERAGLLVRPDDPRDLAAALARVLEEPELRQGLMERGYRTAETHDWTRIVARLESVYRRVIAARRTNQGVKRVRVR